MGTENEQGPLSNRARTAAAEVKASQADSYHILIINRPVTEY